MARVRRKQCEMKGCRRLARPGIGLCAQHEKEANEAAHPIDGVLKISELRAYKFAALDAELRNGMLAIRNLELEMDQARVQYETAQKARATQKHTLASAAKIKKQEYDKLVMAIAEEFNLDPTKMTIDPDSQVVRDLRND